MSATSSTRRSPPPPRDFVGAVNIGTGSEVSVLDLIEVLRELGGDGDGFEPEFAPPRAGEVQRIALDAGLRRTRARLARRRPTCARACG